MTLLDPVGRFLGLPPPVARRVDVTRRIPVRMRDGTILRTDHYAPRLPGAPTVLVRTPYGRRVPTNLLCRAIAFRGFHVVLQSCRGTFDSGGPFEPMLNEHDDGLDTLDWLGRQPWYDGRLLTYGPSYVGFVQWALAADAGEQLKGMVPIVTAASFAEPTYAGGSFSLDTVLTWASIIAAQRGPWTSSTVELLRGQPRLRRGLAHLPLGEADVVATGAEVEFFRRWLAERGPAVDYWTKRGHSRRLTEIDAPILMVGGWYDIFLPWQLEDYATLRAAGRAPLLTIGPWTHGSAGLFRESAAESVRWFQSLTGAAEQIRELPVRVHVGGADVWREYPDWPPPGVEPRRWFLQPDGELATTKPDAEQVGEFVYNPADPTPALGGPRLMAKIAGRTDNREHEQRPDVLTFTTAPLTEPVEALGPVTAALRVRATGPYFDVFVRLCDVDPEGHSWNVCDGLTRVSTVDEGEEVRIRLWPTAYRFAAGHRIRIQVSGGAHPRFARNPGTGAALDEPTELVAVRQVILTPSAIELSIDKGGPD
jgi:putative CocE/NonD family hydrolase